MSVKRWCPWHCSVINNECFLVASTSINLKMGHRCTQGRPESINQSSSRRFTADKRNIYLAHLHVCHREDQVRWQLEGGGVGSSTIPLLIATPLADHRRDDHSHGALVPINAYNAFHFQTHPAGRSICVSSRQSPCPQNWKVIGQVRVEAHKALLGKCYQEARAQWVQLNRLS